MRNTQFFVNGLKILLLIVLIGSNSIFIQAANSSPSENFGGLYFFAHQVIKDKRTSLVIGSQKSLSIDRGFNLSFDLILRDERSVFGYVCRVVANDTTNIDILSSNLNGDDALWLVFGNSNRQLVLLKDVPKFKKGEWMKVRLSYLPQSKSIEMSLNGSITKIQFTKKVPLYDQFKFYFGVNGHSSFFTSDAAPIIIKDIVISDIAYKELYHWTLREHGVNSVFDKIKKAEAHVKNPSWLVDKHVHWQLVDSLEVPVKPLVAYNTNSAELYVVNPATMHIFGLGGANVLPKKIISYSTGMPFETMANQLIYNKYTDELWSYNLDGTGISKYSFKKNAWSMFGKNTQEPSYWHHNAQISPVDSSLICFGGYGYYTYHSVLQKYNEDSARWDKKSLMQEIQPRYLSASTIQNNEMFIFGGFGNKTGKQQLSPHSFCDLYSISLPDLKVTKKWEFKKLEGMVYAQSLIVDKNGSDFYTLGYNGMRFNTWIHLFKLNKDRGELVDLADSIPYQFSDTESYCDVFYVSENSSFVAVTVHRTIQNRYRVNVFKLSYPAFTVDDVLQIKTPQKSSGLWIYMLFIGIMVVFSVSSWVVFKKINKVQSKKRSIPLTGLTTQRNLASTISLIGGFQAIDRDGTDITALFTPHIRHIFLLMILYTYKTNKGISSSSLDEILWSDKTEASARNNRNVNINKLKSIVEKLDGLEINNDNSYWHTILNPPFVCDYVASMEIAQQVKTQPENVSIEMVELFLSMISQGLLLPNIQTEWADSFKAEYSSVIMDTLLHLAKESEKTRDYQLMLKLADAMLIQDSIDEDALHFKCKALVSLGKKNAALSFYTSFCHNYKNILAEDYPIPFTNVT
ncbi:MAG TPA: hypothetical protein VFP20_00170 [Bacteroidales bacterium]|nr:hypothetical protein [Bacteroidales bacterium]